MKSLLSIVDFILKVLHTRGTVKQLSKGSRALLIDGSVITGPADLICVKYRGGKPVYRPATLAEIKSYDDLAIW